MPKVKQSIKKQYACIFGLLLAGSVILICLINGLALGTFYRYHKEKVLMNVYDRINYMAGADSLDSDEFRKSFNRMASMNNLEMIVLNPDMEVIASTSQDSKRLTMRLMDFIFNASADTETVKNGEKYVIIKSHDAGMNLEFIELAGVLDNGFIISIGTPIESIRDSAIVANRLMLLVGTVSLLCGICIIMVVSSKITKPIMKLVNISERMTHLDFQTKYDSCGKNEIDMLGEHINQLSGALEQTISELKSANLELQKDIEEKTHAEERRKEFIANVSHELKTPIALVQGYAEGLKDCVNDDPESRDFYCDVIVDEASRMNKLVRNLLELNQLESGIDKAVMEQFDIIEVIYNCAQSMGLIIDQNDVQLILPKRESILVWADEFKVEQILNNYLTNAINHASGDKVIKVTCSVQNEVATVKVFNTGDPIPEEAIDQLWNKFYKVDKARTRAYGGSGIGLSIVKAIMDQTGLGYGVKNYDNGVEFYFEVDASSSLPS